MEFDFTKNATVPNLDTVPEVYRGLYVEADGENGKVFTISPVAKGLVEAYMGTSTALNKARSDLKDANAESASRRVTKNSVLEFANSLGIENVSEDEPLGSVKSFIDELTKQVKGGKEVKINLDKMNAEFEKRVGEITASKDAELAGMKTSLEKYLVDQAATAALAEAKGSVSLLLPHVKSRTKVVPEGDGYVVRVVDAAGDAVGDGKGGFLTVAGLVAQMKTQEEFGRAFESEEKRGSGTPPGGPANRPHQQQGGDKTSVDKIAEGLKKGGFSRGQ